MRSIRSTRSSGVGTQITSLPAWPTCGVNSRSLGWVWASAVAANAASARLATVVRTAAANLEWLKGVLLAGWRGAGRLGPARPRILANPRPNKNNAPAGRGADKTANDG